MRPWCKRTHARATSQHPVRERTHVLQWRERAHARTGGGHGDVM